jgi:tetratricopeptide (TPR) repeat protein
MLTDLAMVLAWKGEFEEARGQSRRAQELDPSLFLPQALIGWIDIQAGQIPDAIRDLEKAVAMNASAWVGAWLGFAYGVSGDRARAAKILNQWNEKSPHGSAPPIVGALVHLGMGNRELALDELERAYAGHSQFLVFLRMDRTFDSIRSEPRFIALAEKVGFGK